MKLFSGPDGKLYRRRCALTLSLVLHAAVLIVFWRPGAPLTFKKRPVPKKCEVVFLIAPPNSSEPVESPAVTGTVEPAQPLRPNEYTGPKKSAILRTSWPSPPPEVAKKQAPAFFDIPTKSGRIVFVIDRSASMGRTGAYMAAKRELLASLKHLPKDATFQIVVYNKSSQLLFGAPEWRQASPETILNAAELLDDQIAEGGTDHLRALEKGLWLGGDVLFLLTDADDFTPQQISRASARNRTKCVIHVVQMAGNHALRDSNWRKLAKQNGGVYKLVRR